VKSSDSPLELSRREFVGYSGAAGAAAALAATRLAAPDARSCKRGLAGLCGTTSDGVYLWKSVQACVKDPSRPDCLVTKPEYVVLPGDPENNHDFLLVPTKRIKGIECPLLWTEYKGINYWEDAWTQATNGGKGNVTYSVVGLGVNSVGPRKEAQLHIHMAGFRDGAFEEIKRQDGKITRQPGAWPDSIIEVDGYLYRALHLPSLSQNIFVLLYDDVVRPLKDDMGEQAVLVTKAAGGFYVLDTQGSLKDSKYPGKGGTDTCDRLLVYA
jgi:CDP-diacylglycerol pyrophosphatase